MKNQRVCLFLSSAPQVWSWYGCGIVVVFFFLCVEWINELFDSSSCTHLWTRPPAVAQLPAKERTPKQTLSVLQMDAGKALTILSPFTLIHIFICSHMTRMFLAKYTWFVSFDGSSKQDGALPFDLPYIVFGGQQDILERCLKGR